MEKAAAPTAAPLGETSDSRASGDPGLIRRGARGAVNALAKVRPEVWVLIALSSLLNLWAIDQNGWANEYYSAAVRSMSESWHNFLFGSFDAAGVMTVDKPPLALWIQALSVRAFGFSTTAILLPQALMGVASVVLTYDLTRRVFGRVAGTTAGLVLALTPISAAIFRHNNPDALLVLFSVAALWFVVRGFEDGRTRWLLLAGLMVGLGFETKMGAALLVLPGLAAAWIWVAPGGSRLRALWQLVAAGGVALVAALAWPVLVWLTPEGSRPWISGTADNSIWSLITGYNGVGRVAGQAGGPGGMGGGPGGGGMGRVFGGDTGLFRLIGSSLGGQAGWLLGLSLGGGALVAIQSRLRRDDPRTGWVIATGGIFLTIAVVFSFASGIFHPYYVSQLAPFAAALVGAGVAGLVSARGNLRPWTVPVVALAVVAEIVVLHNSDAGYGWLIPILIGVGVGAAVLLAVTDDLKLRTFAACGLTAALMIVPAIWSFQTLGHATSGTFPAGGPSSQAMGGGPGGGGPGGMTGGPGGMQGSGGASGSGSFPAMPGSSGPGSSGQSFHAPPGGMTPPIGMIPPPGINGMAPPGMSGSSSSAGSSGTGSLPGTPGTGSFPGGSGSGGFPGGMSGGPGGMGGPGGQDLSSAIATAAENGGGNVAVSGQQTAASAVITNEGGSDVNVVALGGFSGRESEVSASWLAERVADGDIRWVLTDQTSMSPADGRTGSSELMSAVTSVCEPVEMESTGSTAATVSTASDSAGSNVIYDCAGKASALAAQ